MVKEAQMKVTRGLVFWYDNVGVRDKTQNLIKIGEGTIRSSIIAGRRPWIVVAGNGSGPREKVCTVVPITSSETVEAHGRLQYKHKGKTQTVLVEQIQTVNVSLMKDFAYVLEEEIMELVDESLAKRLGIHRLPEKDSLWEEQIAVQEREIARDKEIIKSRDSEILILKNEVTELHNKLESEEIKGLKSKVFNMARLMKEREKAFKELERELKKKAAETGIIQDVDKLKNGDIENNRMGECKMQRYTRVEIGQFVREGRKKRRMTQPMLALLLGKNEKSVRRYEKGEVEMPKDVAVQLSEILDIPVMALLGFKG